MTTMPLHLSLDSMDPLLECMPSSFAQKQLPRGQLCGRVGWVATTAIAVESGGSPHHVQGNRVWTPITPFLFHFGTSSKPRIA